VALRGDEAQSCEWRCAGPAFSTTNAAKMGVTMTVNIGVHKLSRSCFVSFITVEFGVR
jgi:hypothetical protein